jgi:6-phospho-3-hexuloisomerase
MSNNFETALGELGAVADRIDPREMQAAMDMIANARRIVLYGCGREGLQLRGFAMRLHHLGLDVAMQGDMATPPVGTGDLLIVSAGPGELATVTALMRVARNAGADVVFLTAVPETPSASLANCVLTIPAQTMASDQGKGVTSVLPMGSVFEGALFLLFEIMVLGLRDRLAVTPEAMRARHTNLE